MRKRTRVKICGITSPDDALAAAEAGADAIGLVFYEQSPRNVSFAKAREIAEALPAFVSVVGLFVDPEAGFVQSALDQVALDLLQFHGDEPEPFCRQQGRPYIKAVRMQDGVDLAGLCHTYASSRGILLDAYVPGQAGGTGQTFDWSRIPSGLSKPVILAGGLSIGNVAEAVRQVQPWAVDVSGGVEVVIEQNGTRVVKKGHKDAEAIRAFIEGVNSVSKRA